MYPAQQNATDQTANFFWLLIILTIGALVFWWLEKSYIVRFIFFIRHYEIDLIQWTISGVNVVTSALHLPAINTSALSYWQQFMITADKEKILFPQVTSLSDAVGLWLRYPVMLVLLILAAYLFFHNRSTRFRQIYTMQSLRKLESENWPQITPVLSLDLVKQNLKEGPWAMAKLPLDFCKQHDLLKISQGERGEKIWQLRSKEVERLFVLQMGPLWQGAEALPIHVKALLVIFLTRAHRDHDVAEKLLEQISESASHGKLDFSGVEEYLQKYQHSKIIPWLEKRHAYVGTFMASLLEIARTDGVLATAEFLWLKPVDRRLWFMLNSVGRQTAVVEVAGLFAHWLTEKKLKRHLRTPMVKEAVNALEEGVKDILYVAEEERWHTSLAA